MNLDMQEAQQNAANQQDAHSPLPEPTLDQRLSLIESLFDKERTHRIHAESLLEKEKRARTSDSQEDERLTKVLKAVFEAQGNQKESKLSHRTFTFSKFDGRKDGRIVLSWLSQCDDYFCDEPFSEKDKLKCVANHMVDKASLWWNVLRHSADKPTTWIGFQAKVKESFLPPQFYLQARRAWNKLSCYDRETVPQYTERFWQTLLHLRMLEEVNDATLQQKYEDGLHEGIQAEVNMFKPSSLYEAISLAHDAEKKLLSISKFVRPMPNFQQRPPPPLMSGNRNFKRFVPPPRTNNFQPRAHTYTTKNVFNGAPTKPNIVNSNPKPNSGAHNMQKATKPTSTCHRCNKSGHIAANCYARLPPKKPTPMVNNIEEEDYDGANEDATPDWTEETLHEEGNHETYNTTGTQPPIHSLLRMQGYVNGHSLCVLHDDGSSHDSFPKSLLEHYNCLQHLRCIKSNQLFKEQDIMVHVK